MTHSNPNLIAKPTVDSNGKQTTVYVNIGKLNNTEDTSNDRVRAHVTPPKLSHTPGVYQFLVAVDRTETNVYLPRKRQPRTIEYVDHVIVDVPVVDSDDAVVSMKLEGTEYRYFDGILYRPKMTDNGVAEAEDFFAGAMVLSHFDDDSYGYKTPEYVDVYNHNADNYIVVDGAVWEKTSEPKYIIHTNGYIWGSTLSISVQTDVPLTDNERTFSALERDLAIAKAYELSESLDLRGNREWNSNNPTTYYYDDAIKKINELPEIEVIDPSGVGSTYDFPIRIEYPQFHKSLYYYDGQGGAEAQLEEFNKTVTGYRDILETVPNALEKLPSGVTKINWAVLPDGMKRNYDEVLDFAKENGYLI